MNLKKPVPQDRTIVNGIWLDILDDWANSFVNDGDNSALGVNLKNLAMTAYGEAKAEENTPITQIKASYGLLGLTLTVTDASASGTNTVVNDLFTSQTGTTADGLASILTLRQISSRAGQGISVYFDAIFTNGVAASQQAAGLITSENSYVFAFLGVDFGIAHTFGGISEQQELTVTTAAIGAETATITIDGNPFSVPLTAGTVQHNAFEIALSLEAQVTNYDFTSNDNQVIAQSLISGPQGVFSFSSTGTAVAAWVQDHAGLAASLDFIKQEDWNVDTRLTETDPSTNRKLDPTNGNLYQIQLCANFGSVRFFLEDHDSGTLKLVHIIKAANIKTTVNSTNLAFRLGWLAQNLGNTTNLTVQGNSAGSFIEGKLKRSTPPRSEANIQLAVGTPRTNIIMFRNRIHFGGKVNRADIVPLLATLSTQSNKSAFFEIIANPVFTGDADFSYVDKTESLMEIATDPVIITGGRLLGAVTVVSGSSEQLEFNTRAVQEFVALPGQSFAIAARISGGAAADMEATGTWAEDV